MAERLLVDAVATAHALRACWSAACCWSAIRWLESRDALVILETTREAKMAMMAITTSSSTREKAFLGRSFCGVPLRLVGGKEENRLSSIVINSFIDGGKSSAD